MPTIKLTDSPFAWVSHLNWDDLATHSDADEYAILDDIYRILTDGFDPHNIYHDAVLAMTLDEMKEYYNSHFPKLLGHYLENIGQGLQDGTYELEISTD